MTTVLLRFISPLGATPGPVLLRFGVDLAFAERVPGTLAAAIPGPASPPLVLSALGTISTEVWTDVGPAVGASHRQHRDGAAGLITAQHQAQPTRSAGLALQQHAAPLAAPLTAAQQSAAGLGNGLASPQQSAVPLTAARTLRYAEAIRTQRTATAPAQHGIPLQRLVAAPWAEAIRTRRRAAAPAQHAAPVRAAAATPHQHGRPIARRLHTPAQQMLPLPVGWWQATYPWPEPPFDPNAPSSPVALRFCHLADGTTALVFGCRGPGQPGAPIVVPISEAYLVINDFSLVRVDTGQPIEVEDFSATLDADSWTWGWSASLHADLMPLVRSPALGEHVELLATINATPLHLVVERMGRDRRFANARLKVSGRGRAAWLAAPHAPVATRYNAEARTAQQLLADALTLNGVGIGWTVDWRITDWMVPAGAWSHQGSYMDAATRIAEAGGGYVQAHDTDQTLIIMPRYPAAPWNWAAQAPDIDLPEDVCEVEGIEWQDKPAYNAVWVHGGEAGRRDRIRRTGTAADRTAPTIVDPLATAPEMTRQRGLATLGDTGRQAHITLRLPVLEETGIIQPGKLIRYTESGVSRLGLSRSVQVDHRFPDLWQTIRIETHELESV